MMMNRRVVAQCVKIYGSALRRSTSSSPNLASLIYAEKNGEHESYRGQSSEVERVDVEKEDRVSILVDIINSPGSLHHILKYFWEHKVDLTCIESRPSSSDSSAFKVYIDFKGVVGEKTTMKLLRDLRANCRGVKMLDNRVVPWFPKDVAELDLVANKTLEAGVDIESDHPGFLDQEYRQRRAVLAGFATGFRYLDPLPLITYTEEENKTWGLVYNRLQHAQSLHACAEYLSIMPLMQEHCGYGPDKIPQARHISTFLEQRTGFRLRPVAGLLSSRDFLNALAFKIFFSTQYIRHSSRPFYTPEPDICHELLGHAPMFADPDFAAFSQEIGLASLGASDADIVKLATCYWHSVEFGLVKEGGNIKAYGAGLLSSFGELEYACASPAEAGLLSSFGELEYACASPAEAGTEAGAVAGAGAEMPSVPQLLPWEPERASQTKYPITSYQPVYFVAESLSDAKSKMRTFCASLPRPFYACYNPQTSSVWIDRAVKTMERTL